MRSLRRLLAPALLSVLAAFSMGATGSCGDTIVVDTANPSVPTVQLQVRANNVTVIAAGGETRRITARSGMKVDILGVGEDPVGGVWQVTVTREAFVDCVSISGDLAVRMNYNIAPETFSSPATNGQEATTGGYVNQSTLAPRCRDGFVPRSGAMYVSARARSFSARYSAIANVIVDVVP